MIPQLLATLALFAALSGPPDMVADSSWYGGAHHGQLTASGQVYSVEGHSCAIRREFWEDGWACGYGRGPCERLWLCGARGCLAVEINDTGAWGWPEGHEFDCTPRVFEDTMGHTDIGIGQVRVWRLP